MKQTDNTTLAVAQALIALLDKNKALEAEMERMKSELRKLWYLCRERRKRPYITPVEYNFLFGLEGRLESLLATDTNVLTNAATSEKEGEND